MTNILGYKGHTLSPGDILVFECCNCAEQFSISYADDETMEQCPCGCRDADLVKHMKRQMELDEYDQFINCPYIPGMNNET